MGKADQKFLTPSMRAEFSSHYLDLSQKVKKFTLERVANDQSIQKKNVGSCRIGLY
jgi:hypothetical protein